MGKDGNFAEEYFEVEGEVKIGQVRLGTHGPFSKYMKLGYNELGC